MEDVCNVEVGGGWQGGRGVEINQKNHVIDGFNLLHLTFDRWPEPLIYFSDVFSANSMHFWTELCFEFHCFLRKQVLLLSGFFIIQVTWSDRIELIDSWKNCINFPTEKFGM